MSRFAIITTLALIFTFPLMAQKKMVRQLITNLEARQHYPEAARLNVALFESGHPDASVEAAWDYYRAGSFIEAGKYFQIADSLGFLKDRKHVFAYFETLKAEKRYQEADEIMDKFLAGQPAGDELGLHAKKAGFYERVSGFAETCVSGLAINSPYSEIGPCIYGGWLYFESTRPTQGNRQVHALTNQPFYNFYTTPESSAETRVVRPEGEFGKPETWVELEGSTTKSLPGGINHEFHDGPIYVTPDGTHMFYTSNRSNDERNVRLHLFHSQKRDSIWTEPVLLPFNNAGYSTAHATFHSPTSTLFFSSDMPGGQGGFDIWKSEYREGNWSQPVNLGKGVNTPQNEVFPAIAPDGTLIFSSNGWPGLGGLDLFLFDKRKNWSLNMLAGLNSERDDFGVWFVSERAGYLVSNRSESIGDDDIFRFETDLKSIWDFHIEPVKVELVSSKDGKPIKGEVEFERKGKTVEETVSEQSAMLKIRDGGTVKARSEGHMPAEVIWSDDQEVLTIRMVDAVEATVVLISAEDGLPLPGKLEYEFYGRKVEKEISVQGETLWLPSEDTISFNSPGKSGREYVVGRLVTPGKPLKILLGEPSLDASKKDDLVPVTLFGSEDGHSVAGRLEYTLDGRKMVLLIPVGGEVFTLPEGVTCVVKAMNRKPVSFVVNGSMKKSISLPLLKFELKPAYYQMSSHRKKSGGDSGIDDVMRLLMENPGVYLGPGSEADCKGRGSMAHGLLVSERSLLRKP